MTGRSRIGAVALLLLILMLAACGGAEPAPADGGGEVEAQTGAPVEATTESAPATSEMAEVTKVAFVYVSQVGDLGWTWAHDQGALAVEEHFGAEVEVTRVENVPEGPESTRVIRDLAQKGNDIIFTTSFGYMDPTIEVAAEYPDTWFVHVSGFKTADNVSTLFGRMYIPRYLSGIAAGAATESGIVGYVAAFPIPEVIRGINAFTLGVRSIRPEAEVRVVYTSSWFDPPREREAAQALLDEGADVIAQHQDTTEPQKAAQEADALSIGYDSDMRSFVGDSVLTSPVWNWAPKYIDIIEQVRAGTYSTESFWGADIVGLAEFSPQVDARIVDVIQQQQQAISSGVAEVFCGPITSNTGVEVVAAGSCLTDGEMLSMAWYVDGVVAESAEAAPSGIGEASDKIPARQISE